MKKYLTILSVALLAAPSAFAGDIARGEEKSKPCQACHGPDGNSTAGNFPTIAGQYRDYIVKSLEDYKSGARKNAIMAGMAAPLSEQDIEDLAAYYSNQKGLKALNYK